MSTRAVALMTGVGLIGTALAGCGGSAVSLASPTASPFSLYTHCGINDIRIGNQYYRAEKPLSDGHGNPPPGWGNPYQTGTITLVSASTAVFQDSKHHHVTFRLRPGATGYPHVCD